LIDYSHIGSQLTAQCLPDVVRITCAKLINLVHIDYDFIVTQLLFLHQLMNKTKLQRGVAGKCS